MSQDAEIVLVLSIGLFLLVLGAVSVFLLAHFLPLWLKPHARRRPIKPPADDWSRHTPFGAVSGSPYRATPSLLTPAEERFYRCLRRAVGPQTVICIKPRLADVLLPTDGNVHAFRRVSQKHVDFLLCHPSTLRPLVAVELDDRSHNWPDRERRDRFVDSAFAGAGLPLLHVPVQTEYDAAQLLAAVQPYFLAHPRHPA